MAMLGRWGWLLLCVPVQAFVFVPQRAQGGVQPAWHYQRPPQAAVRLAADLDGNLYLSSPTAIEALAAGSGERLWRHEAPAGMHYGEPVLPGGAAVVAIARSDAVPAEALVTALAIEPAEGQARVLWERRGQAIPPGGVFLPLAADREQGDQGLLALVAGEQLLVLDLADGRVRHRTELGTPRGEPVWAPNRVWVPLADGSLAQATLDGQPVRRLTLPGDQAHQVTAVCAGGPVVLGRNGVYLLRPTGAPLLVGQAGERAIPAAEGFYTAGTTTFRALSPEGQVRWSWPLPTGWGSAEAALPGEAVVLLTLRRADAPSAARVVALHAADGSIAWQAEGQMPAGGAQKVASAGGELVGLLLDGELQVREAANGAERARRALGGLLAPPVWVADSGFVATTAGLAGFDLPLAGQAEDPARAWLWKADEPLEAVTWLPTGRLLVAVGPQRIHVFE